MRTVMLLIANNTASARGLHLSCLVAMFLFRAIAVFAQERGASAVNQTDPPQGRTFAVVVGISDYQSPEIVDLKFADQDAKVFANWLEESHGGVADREDVVLLLNGEATRANFNAALDWLVEKCRSGDRAILFFSGHGDAESKTKFNRGFLLFHDSPPNNYAAGAFSLNMLQDYLSTLSDSAKVLMVADACRSGKLAGSTVQGSQLTAAELAKQYGKETKILSCQPEEVSLEGRQWGGGRGVFSYFLMESLYGLADGDQDQVVTLREVSRYVPEKIIYEISPLEQTPMFVGNMKEPIAKVDSNVMQRHVAQIGNSRKIQLSVLESRGQEERILAGLDSSLRQAYYGFKDALAGGRFFEPPGSNAEEWYASLSNNKNLAPLHSLMRRNYAAGLQNEVQQAINNLLEDDPYEYYQWKFTPSKYRDYPKYLQRAIELLGEKHPAFKLLESQRLYFEAYVMLKDDLPKTRGSEEIAKVKLAIRLKLNKAIDYNPTAAYLYFLLAESFWDIAGAYSFDSMRHYFFLTTQYAPTWLNPYHTYFNYVLNSEVNEIRADSLLRIALNMKPQSWYLRLCWSWLRQRQNLYEQSDSICRVLLSERPELLEARATLVQGHAERYNWRAVLAHGDTAFVNGVSEGDFSWAWYLAGLLNTGQQKAFADAIRNQSVAISSNEYLIGFFGVGVALTKYHLKMGQSDSAQAWASQLLESGSLPLHLVAEVMEMQGDCLLRKGDYDGARTNYQKAMHVDHTPSRTTVTSMARLAKLASREGALQRADSLFNAALADGVGFFWYGQEEAHCLYGDFLLEQDRIEKAIFHYRQANSITPNYYEPWLGLAKCELVRGNREEATIHLAKALENYCPQPEAFRNDKYFKQLNGDIRFEKLLVQYKHLNAAK
ncbi:MAG: caspase family protein [Saprospiraceae bacterium]|nr:caspase family protein [Saprospiraceae bacterium]